MAESRNFQKMGFAMYFEAACAPKPIVTNQIMLATLAPVAKYQRSLPN